jgi:NarL family two-component system response regulator LiaR
MWYNSADMEKIKVLLAEDHAVVREGLRELIERQEDMQVVGEAGDGEETIRLADELGPDLVLMDIALPKLNGIEATRRIKELHPFITILVLTAYDNEEFIFALLEAGAAGYLLKNVESQELLDAIHAVYNGDSVLYPTVAAKVFKHLQAEKNRKYTKQERTVLLSGRELEVIRLGAEGLINKQIAKELSVGERTIQSHWRNIFNKLGVSSRTEALMEGLRRGWIVLKEEEEDRL